jgi:hypothetical protein
MVETWDVNVGVPEENEKRIIGIATEPRELRANAKNKR